MRLPLFPVRRGLFDRKGELFAWVLGDQLVTLDDEPAGFLRGDHIVDLAGRPVWRLIGDGVYLLDALEPVGYLGAGSSYE